MSATGLLSGKPAPGSGGNYNAKFTVIDAANTTATVTFLLNIVDPAGPTITSPSSLPSGIVGVFYGTVKFTQAGGTLDASWSATGLPDGLFLNGNGALSGWPATDSAGTYHPQFTVSDTKGTATRMLSLTIDPSSPIITSVSPNPVRGLNGNQTVFINGSGFLSTPFGPKVRLTRPRGQTDLSPGGPVNYLSTTQLSMVIDTGTAPANWTAQVINGDGSMSNVFSFSITSPTTTTSFALPQFVFGGSWYTALYFANPSASGASVTVNFMADDGSPLSVPLAGIGTVTSQTINLNPSSTVILEALNSGPARQGWVEAALPTGVVGYGVFRQVITGRADQEAVVPLTPESSQTADLIYDDIQFTTSVAFLNPTNQPANATISVFGADGSSLGSTQISLPPRSKQAKVLKTLAGLEGIAGNLGRAVFSVSTGAVSVLGLRFGGEAFTSIPVTHRTNTQSSSTSFALPQFVFGGTWYTALYFSNATNSPVSFPVTFIGDDGVPLNTPLAAQTVNLNPGATVILEAPNTATPGQGWAEATLPPGVVGYAVFRQSIQGRADQEAVVPLTSESSQAADLVYDDVLLTTSVAFLNPSDQPVVVTITTYTAAGLQNGIAQKLLQPHSKQAIELKSIPALRAVAGNRGWAAFSVSSGAVSVLGLRFGGEAFTSIPVPHR